MDYTKAELIVMPIMLIGIILIGLLLRFLLKNKSAKIRNIPLTIIAITLLVLEVVKQIYLIATKSWTTWSIPIHFCSFFLFWFAFAQFSKGKVQQVGYSCAICGGILMTILFYIGPRSIIGSACENPFRNFSTFHTFIFHFLAVAYWIWLLLLNLYKPEKKHILQTSVSYSIYYLMILTLAHIFDTNYTNSLYSNIPFMEALRVNHGQVIYTIILIAFGIAAIAAISGLMNLIHILFKKKTQSSICQNELNEAENTM